MADADVGRARTIRVPDELWEWFKDHAAEQDRETAWLVRTVLADYRRRVDGRKHRAKPRAEESP